MLCANCLMGTFLLSSSVCNATCRVASMNNHNQALLLRVRVEMRVKMCVSHYSAKSALCNFANCHTKGFVLKCAC